MPEYVCVCVCVDEPTITLSASGSAAYRSGYFMFFFFFQYSVLCEDHALCECVCVRATSPDICVHGRRSLSCMWKHFCAGRAKMEMRNEYTTNDYKEEKNY